MSYVYLVPTTPNRKYSFSTGEGRSARVVVPTTLDVSASTLVIEVSRSSTYKNSTSSGYAIYRDGEIVMNFTAGEVDVLRDCFYRLKAVREDGQVTILLEGSISFEPYTGDKEDILDSDGTVRIKFVDPLVEAMDEFFLKKEDYLPVDQDTLGTSQNLPNTIVRRDANGRGFFERVFISQFPDAGNDAANKGYVDGVAWPARDRANHSGTQSADTIVDGTANKVMTSDDRVLLRQVTPENLGWHTVRRDATGSFSATAVKELSIPVNPGDAANKGYVDAMGTSDNTAGTIVRRNQFGQSAFTEVMSNKVFVWNAPTAADHATRKDYVDALGVSTPTANTIARRDANGFVQFARVDISNAPGGSAHATRKDYVDAGDAAAIVRAQYGNSMWSIGGAEPFARPSNQVGLVSDFVTFSCFTAPVANTITKLSIPVETAGVGMTWFQMGLYTIGGDGRLTLVARTANNPTAAQTVGIQSLALDATGGFPTSYTFVPGQRYAFGLRGIGSTNLVMQSWFLFTGGQYAPYIAQQLYLGTTTGLPTGTFAAGGTWWNAPYVVGLP